MNFDDAVGFLDRHINLEKMVGLAGRTEGLSLERMQTLVGVLGDPQKAAPVIQVTGTNGKGSTTRMIAALLTAHDLTVGTYTSPHIEQVTERITWGGEPIDRGELARVVGELADLEPLLYEELGGDRPSYFELLTALAYSYFADVAAQVVVAEVGMLGRYDATNVAEATVAVVTNVGKDHTDGQGDWRRRVAEEKAGIIAPDSRVVLGETDPELLPVFEAEPHADLWVRDRDFGVAASTLAMGGRVLDVQGRHGRYEELFLPVHGLHQAENVACAIAAVEALFDRELDIELVREALAGLTLPGRFEVVHRQPLVALDGAHNPQGAAALASTLADDVTVSGQRHWVLGLLTGRDLGEMFEAFGVGPGDHVVACSPSTARAVPAADVAVAAVACGATSEVVDEVEAAVERAWLAAGHPDGGPEADAADEGDGPTSSDGVIVTGSLYTVGAARRACRNLGLLDD